MSLAKNTTVLFLLSILVCSHLSLADEFQTAVSQLEQIEFANQGLEAISGLRNQARVLQKELEKLNAIPVNQQTRDVMKQIRLVEDEISKNQFTIEKYVKNMGKIEVGFRPGQQRVWNHHLAPFLVTLDPDKLKGKLEQARDYIQNKIDHASLWKAVRIGALKELKKEAKLFKKTRMNLGLPAVLDSVVKEARRKIARALNNQDIAGVLNATKELRKLRNGLENLAFNQKCNQKRRSNRAHN